MAERLQVYRCGECGIILEVLEGGGGCLVCCGEPMQLLDEKTADAATEKHVPVIEKLECGCGYKVTVGSVPHPMADDHYIQWIELLADGKVYREFLCPGGAPEATFAVCASDVSAREYCNKHGLWKA